MKVVSYITPDMKQMNEELRYNMIQYEKRLKERGYYIREKRILTATIVLYILEQDDGELCCGWAYYPKTRIEDFISCICSESNLEKDEFAETCTSRVLKNHNWHNHDVECAIRNRNTPVSAA